MKKPLIVVAVAILFIVLGAGAMQYLLRNDNSALPSLPGTDSGDPGIMDALPAQPAWCPAYEFISAPGTWESAAGDDPLNPTANPHSFMLSITGPLRERFGEDQVRIWTLPYTAQFRSVQSQDEMSYDDSRNEGRARLEEELRWLHGECPHTQFILSGFSQGAVIVGDIADDIGGGVGVIPAESVAGVAVVADGRRQNGVGINPGVELGGVGAEVALQPVTGLIQLVVPGASMRGPRPHGFGALADRTYEICAPSDSVCDAPLNINNGVDRALELINANGIHAMYASNGNVIPGTTANQWITNWAAGIIESGARG
ncbi:MAG: cutinase family protein [Corynebacterium sp.]|nr:cutinase family protein [Corynebacterium sp.]